MDVYTLGKVDTVTSGRDNLYQGFNVIGVHVIGLYLLLVIPGASAILLAALWWTGET